MEHPTTRHTNKTMRKNLSYFKSCRSTVLFYFTYNQVLHVLQVCSRIPSFNTCRKLRVEVWGVPEGSWEYLIVKELGSRFQVLVNDILTPKIYVQYRFTDLTTTDL